MASELHVDAIKHSGGTSALTIDSSGNLTTNAKLLSTGHVIQVLQSQKTDTFTTTSVINSGGFVDLTGLSVNITPASSSSKFLISAKISGMIWTQGHTYFQLVRDSTVIGVGDSASSRATVASSSQQESNWGVTDHVTSCLDSPSTSSQITYKVQCGTEYGTLYVNRSNRDTDAWYDVRTSSEITVMEIAG